MAVFFDFDSTIVSKESLDEAIALALSENPERNRIVKEIEEITNLGMEGKLNFTESVLRRIKVIPPTKKQLEETGRMLTSSITPGMPELFAWLRENGHVSYIATGGFEECIIPVASELQVPRERILSNRFLFSPLGIVTGIDESSLLWTNEGKGPALLATRAKHPNETCIIVGDGMNDYRAYESGAADYFIGFGGNVVRKAVEEKAQYFTYTVDQLWEILRNEIL